MSSIISIDRYDLPEIIEDSDKQIDAITEYRQCQTSRYRQRPEPFVRRLSDLCQYTVLRLHTDADTFEHRCGKDSLSSHIHLLRGGCMGTYICLDSSSPVFRWFTGVSVLPWVC